MPIPPADVVVNPDGSIDLNARLRFLNPFDINTTGVGTITVLPDVSLAAFLPLLGRGDNGLSPVFDTPTQHEVAPADPLPTPAATLTLADPGDPLATPPVPPTWHLEYWVHKGSQGDPGDPVNLEALANVLAPGTLVNGTTVVYRTSDNKWHIEAVRVTDAVCCTSFVAASGNAANQVLGSLTFPARAYQRQPIVSGACQVNPAADATTHIDLLARLGDQNTGLIIGFGQGLDVGTAFIANLHPTPAAYGAGAIIDTGNTAQVFLIAQQTNATLSNWSTTMTHAAFDGLAVPLL